MLYILGSCQFLPIVDKISVEKSIGKKYFFILRKINYSLILDEAGNELSNDAGNELSRHLENLYISDRGN